MKPVTDIRLSRRDRPKALLAVSAAYLLLGAIGAQELPFAVVCTVLFAVCGLLIALIMRREEIR